MKTANAPTRARQRPEERVAVAVGDRGDAEEHDRRDREREDDPVRQQEVREVDHRQRDQRRRRAPGTPAAPSCRRSAQPIAANSAPVPSTTSQPTGVRSRGADSGNGPASSGRRSGTRSMTTGSSAPTTRPSTPQPGGERRGHRRSGRPRRRRASRRVAPARPVNASNASAAWCTSIPSPFAAATPRARGRASSGVSAGWYTVSSDEASAHAARRRRRAASSPCMPSGVAFTTTSHAVDDRRDVRELDRLARRARARRRPRAASRRRAATVTRAPCVAERVRDRPRRAAGAEHHASPARRVDALVDERADEPFTVGRVAERARRRVRRRCSPRRARRPSADSSSHAAAASVLCGIVTLSPAMPSARTPSSAAARHPRRHRERDEDPVETERRERGVVDRR